jgi:thioredoxin-like negative regulator of GroEL
MTPPTYADALEASKIKPVFTLFVQDNCQPCQYVKHTLRKAAVDYGFPYCELRIEENMETVRALKVRAAPTMLVLDKGRVVDTHTGAITYELLRAKFVRFGVIPPAPAEQPQLDLGTGGIEGQ